jgi:hypothetical protein
MSHYVYKLKEENGKILHVGETVNPTQRMYSHRGIKKSKFYGLKFSMEIIKQFPNKKMAYEYQCQLQEQYGLITDRQRMARTGENNPHTKLTNDQVREIKRNYTKGQGAALGRKFGVSRMVIGKIINGQSYKTIE